METISLLLLNYVVNALWIVLFVAAVAWLCARLMQRTQVRHVCRLWITGLVLSVLLPMAGLRPIQLASHNTARTNMENAVPERSALLSSKPSASFFWTTGAGHRQRLPVLPLLATTLMGLYCTLILYGTARVGLSWVRTRSSCLAATAVALPRRFRTAAADCFRALGVRPKRVAVSQSICGPATAGIRHTVLMFPVGFLQEASVQDFTSALCHELAHIRRRDFLWNLVCELLLIPIWFHPAATLIKRRIDRSREIACDEMAAERMATRTAYARSLLNLANKMLVGPRTAAYGYTLGLFDADTLEERIVALLKTKSISQTAERLLALTACTALMAACALSSAFSLQVAPTTRPDDIRPFVGTWEAKFDGKTFQTIKIENKDSKLTGTANHISIALDPDGNLVDAKAKEGEDQITSAKVEGKVLRLTCTGKAHVNTDAGTSDTETTQYEMKLTGTDEAEIHPFGDGVDAPQLKPWMLQRVKK